jgi:hypothetical protein
VARGTIRIGDKQMELWDYFVTIVDNYFRYLESEYGFRKTSDKIPLVQYESPIIPLKIVIFLDTDRRREVNLSIYQPLKILNGAEYSIGIDTLIQYYRPGLLRKYINPEYTKEGLKLAVQEVAELLHQYGSSFLRGDLHDLELIEKAGKEKMKKLYGRH